MCIAEYLINICYLEGKANVVTNQLSRPNKEILKTIATIDAPFPDNKMEELREVISSINLYGVDLQELAHEQHLVPTSGKFHKKLEPA